VEAASLSPVLRLDGVKFINLQHGECSKELALIERLHPGKVINLPDIDLYDDFEAVAALMSNLDLIISVPTALLELAGALGCPTMALKRSKAGQSRYIPGTRVDKIWHSITHIESDHPGDVDSLMANLRRELSLFLNSGEWKRRRKG
jgi:capsular polysaccharide export protein